jgi:prepilin-type N-terminal cleavage/methylation domain-containing protein
MSKPAWPFRFPDEAEIPNGRAPHRKAGFSLVELLAALAVFLILMVITISVSSMASDVVRRSNSSADAASQAQIAFERLGLDLGNWIRRPDIDFVATNPPISVGSSFLLFLSAVPSMTTGSPDGGNRRMSMVGYRVAPHPDNGNQLALLRSAKPVGWNQVGFAGLKADGLPRRFSDADFPADLLPSQGTPVSAAEWDILSPGVLRVAVGFVLLPDNLPVQLEDGTHLTARGQLVYSAPMRLLTPSTGTNPVLYPDPGRIAAVVVSLVAIDLESLRILSPNQINQLASAFAVPSTGANGAALASEAWSDLVAHPDGLPGSIPLRARQNLRVFQRGFPLARSKDAIP